MAEMQLQVVGNQRRVVEQGALLQLLCHGPPRQLHHRQQLGAFGRAAQTLDLPQRARIGMQQARQPLAGIQHVLRHYQHVASCRAGAQQQGEQFHIAQRCGAVLQQAFTRTRGVRKIVEGHKNPFFK